MGSLLQQLENEAVLVMYLADELQAEDRAEVEQLLGNDPKLRAALAELREAQSRVVQELKHLDEFSALPASADSAVRRISRIMNQRQLDKLAAAPRRVIQPRRQIPWWVYTAATAAAAVVAVIVWWGMESDPNIPGNGPAVVTIDDVRQQEEQLALLRMTMQNPDDASPIAEVENDTQQLLAQRKESDGPLPLSILGTGEQTQ